MHDPTLQAMEDWAEVLDSGNSIDALYLDFKKALNSVPHEHLLRKLFAYGVVNVRAFLQGRRQLLL